MSGYCCFSYSPKISRALLSNSVDGIGIMHPEGDQLLLIICNVEVDTGKWSLWVVHW